MATLEDIVAATKILSEDPEAIMGGSVSKPKENRAGGYDVMKDDTGSVAVLSERVVEAKTVLESSVGGESVVDSGLVVQEKEKSSIENLSTVVESTVNGSSDEVIVRDGKNKIFEGSSADKGQMNGTRRDGLNMDVDGDVEGEVNGEKSKDQENGFRVGDFVWGKIKSHPWWPGQVYDPKDASEFAMKHKLEGRFLVAFFGDGSCSWCSPSQLRPFVENFAEMSRNSSSKSFLSAVEKAIDEISRLVESQMTCNCIPHEKKDGLANSVVTNAGLKAGVVMPEVDVHRLSIPKFEPKELLEKVRQLAKTVYVGSALELAILRSWRSAFYYFKGGYQLPVYHEPLHIEGLEDKNKTADEAANDFSVPIEVPILGPQDDYSLAPSDDKVFHRRKQKSVAELMGESKNVKHESKKRATAKEGKDFEKSASSQKSKKNNDEVEEAGSRGASSTGKIGRKRKVQVSESPKITNAKILEAENDVDGVKDGPLLKKPKRIEVADAENSSGEAKEESDTVSTPRERKKSKYLSPPYTNLTWRIGNSSFKTAQVGEHKTESVGKESEEKLPNGQVEEADMSIDTSPETVKNGKEMTFPVSGVDAPVNELLSEIRLAAVDPFYLSNKGSFDMVFAFVSALRSSTYLHGPNYKIYRKCKTDRKRKSPPSRLGDLGNDLITSKKADAYKSNVAAETSGAKSSAEKIEGKTSPCLILAFTPGFPLPSKKDIVKLFGKFGSLNTQETKVMTDSHSIKIVYMKDSDAEAAFKSSLTQSPFGSTNVNYKLQRSKKVSSPLKRAADKRDSTDDLVSDGRVIRQKFEIMTAILENYHSKFSPEDKSSLKDEMKHLMEKVDTISEKVRIMAENTSS